jgi:tetratricopeptide (TPR) repeat protein
MPKQLQRLDPNNADACGGMGNVFLMEEHYSQAITHYQEALRLRPNDETLRARLELAERMGRSEEDTEASSGAEGPLPFSASARGRRIPATCTVRLIRISGLSTILRAALR